MPAAQRLDIHGIDAAAYQPMFALEKYIHGGNLGEDLLALVKIRASQINGCAYCLEMHDREARAAGVDDRHLDVLAGWHEASGLYSDREEAALALTEEMTLISQAGVSDQTWERVGNEFTDQDTVTLIMAICAINTWNRMAISTRQALPEVAAPTPGPAS
ncbi:MAG: carboxymuconolactone decarboxylase family protein [Arthrobacter sp.]|uniref:carboxymuconolactone decarboxylase family protein n=1 Tax=unclassified Arthrobacter TaxID=235627 RepID=UPI00264C5D3B|nr:carboxymuconolactone decarboxylase family protein [Micrococcaceae bacterium]MDN5906194.1 carboxymuconolactone decarboxylase family protein [Micrococcaceae bacterium]MDN6169749.1 carboxymuconolactone decarboxylase family protein [Micrococcaceae bacterium]MDN6178482.1 carboxymuconolactone decarboxylase family protein [Micrococcaceae bacterium]MDN6200753.1 carboxymuconolactone decarboxylase family protein [Micrococcaceae bacterium]